MQSMNLIDYHMHTAVTVDAKMNEEQACQRAVLLGIREIAFTNHVMLKQPNYLMSLEDFALHWQQIQACQESYPELKIRLGIEMDYYPGWEQEIAKTLETYQDRVGRSFDLVLGAIHEMQDVFFSSPGQAPRLYRGRDLISIYEDYFALSTEAVRSGLFDILAHPDLIKKYTHELNPPLAFERFRHAVEPFIDAMLDSGVGMDFNMKALTLKVAEPYPSAEFLECYLSRARERGLEPILTLGSDAHLALDVGGNLQTGASLLMSLGHGTLTRFDHRKRSRFEIGSDA